MNRKYFVPSAISFVLLLAAYSNAHAQLPYVVASSAASAALSAAKSESGQTPDTTSRVANYALTAVTSAAGLGLVNAAAQAAGALQHVLPPGPGGRFVNPYCVARTIQECQAGG